MASKDDYLEIEAIFQFCLQKLLKCKTKQETIEALEEITNLLKSENIPTGALTAAALQRARTVDEASVMKMREDLIQRFRDWVSSSEKALSKLESDAPTKPKPRRPWLFVIIGLIVVAICVVLVVSAIFVFLALGGT